MRSSFVRVWNLTSFIRFLTCALLDRSHYVMILYDLVIPCKLPQYDGPKDLFETEK